MSSCFSLIDPLNFLLYLMEDDRMEGDERERALN